MASQEREEKRKKILERVNKTLSAIEERQAERKVKKKEIEQERARFEEERHHLKVPLLSFLSLLFSSSAFSFSFLFLFSFFFFLC